MPCARARRKRFEHVSLLNARGRKPAPRPAARPAPRRRNGGGGAEDGGKKKKTGAGRFYLNLTGFPFPLGPFLERETVVTEVRERDAWE